MRGRASSHAADRSLGSGHPIRFHFETPIPELALAGAPNDAHIRQRGRARSRLRRRSSCSTDWLHPSNPAESRDAVRSVACVDDSYLSRRTGVSSLFTQSCKAIHHKLENPPGQGADRCRAATGAGSNRSAQKAFRAEIQAGAGSQRALSRVAGGRRIGLQRGRRVGPDE